MTLHTRFKRIYIYVRHRYCIAFLSPKRINSKYLSLFPCESAWQYGSITISTDNEKVSTIIQLRQYGLYINVV